MIAIAKKCIRLAGRARSGIVERRDARYVLRPAGLVIAAEPILVPKLLWQCVHRDLCAEIRRSIIEQPTDHHVSEGAGEVIGFPEPAKFCVPVFSGRQSL